MSYQSFTFLLFTATALLVYYAVGRKLKPWVLLAANLVFYAAAGAEYLPFLATTLFATFFCGRAIGKIYDKCDSRLKTATELAEKKQLRTDAKKQAKSYILFSLFIAVGILAVCKYTPFVTENINKILCAIGVTPISGLKIILPLGVSFYTFMAISYVLDIYWKRYKPERNLLYYSVYLTYFPHIVEGPIDRFGEFREQLTADKPFRFENITFGAQLALWGFFKKLVIADRLGIFVDEVVGNYAEYDGAVVIAAFAVYSIQIYADFSGCIDIVSGVSEMFGISLRKNFNHPYFSRTMAEFWRRWHISLQEWFKDYVYFPVSASNFTKNVKKKLKLGGKNKAAELFTACFPILVVWLITGIWHGAAWNYVAWGLFHAALLIGSRVFEPLFSKLNKAFRVDTENFGWHFIQMVRTFILCCIGRIFFRAGGFINSLQIIKRMIVATNPSAIFDIPLSNFDFGVRDLAVIAASVVVLLVVDILQERMCLRKTLAKQNIIFRWVIIFAALFTVIIFGVYGPQYSASAFIYEQF